MNNRAFALSLIALGTLSFSAFAQAKDLNITSYGGLDSEAYKDAYWKPFEHDTGIHINEIVYNGGIGQVRAQIASGNVTWDIAQVELGTGMLGCEEGYFEPLDLSKFPTGDLLPNTVRKCGITSEIASTVMVYNGRKLKKGPATWADFWDEKKFPGKRGLWKNPSGTLEIALLADGVPPGDVYKVLATKEGQDRAFKKLDELRPYITWWSSGTDQIQLLVSGEYDIGTAWNGRVAGANREGQDLVTVWRAGHLMGGDSWVILKGSPHPDTAMKFLQYALTPQRQASFMEHISYGAANQKAYALLPKKLLEELPSSPEHLKYGIPYDAHFWATHTDELEERFNAWLAQ